MRTSSRPVLFVVLVIGGSTHSPAADPPPIPGGQLSHVNLDDGDRILGNWEQDPDSKEVSIRTAVEAARFRIPLKDQAEQIGNQLIKMDFTKNEGTEAVAVNVPLKRSDGRAFQTRVVLGGWGGAVTGIGPYDGLDVDRNATRIDCGRLIDGLWHRLQIRTRTVDRQISVDVQLSVSLPRAELPQNRRRRGQNGRNEKEVRLYYTPHPSHDLPKREQGYCQFSFEPTTLLHLEADESRLDPIDRDHTGDPGVHIGVIAWKTKLIVHHVTVRNNFDQPPAVQPSGNVN